MHETQIYADKCGPVVQAGEAQARLIQTWLTDDWKIEPVFGTDVFDRLKDADIYVAAGLHWTGLHDLSTLIGSAPEPPIWESAQVKKHPYVPSTEKQKSAWQPGTECLGRHLKRIRLRRGGYDWRLLGVGRIFNASLSSRSEALGHRLIEVTRSYRPSGTGHKSAVIPGTSCQATIGLSLRD